MKALISFSFLVVSLTARLSLASDFNLGEEVLNRQGVSAHVVGVSGDNITIQWDGAYGRTLKPSSVPSAEFAHTNGGNGIYSVGDAIVGEAGVGGKVVGVFDNGLLSVRFNGANTTANMESSGLATTLGQIGDFKIGDRVINSRGFCATVIGIYPNQDIEVRWSGNTYRAFRTQLDKFEPSATCR